MSELLEKLGFLAVAFPWSALLHHIFHVFRVRAQKEVSRVYTRGIIAIGAVVAYVQALRNRAISQLIRKPMGKDKAAPQPESPVALIGFPADPKPTTIRLLDVFPESLFSSKWVAAMFPTPVMPMNEAKGLPFHPRAGRGCVGSQRCGPATAAFAKLRGIRYTWHVIISLLDSGRTGDVSASPGLLVPNYSTYERRIRR